MTPRSMILRRTWLRAVSYCAELDSAQYNTAGTSEKLEYLGENEAKNKNILTRWSVAQAGLNDEKNWGSKISLDCPFKSEKSLILKYL